MIGASSLKSDMVIVTEAVLLLPSMSVACTVNMYSSINSRSSTLASKTMRLSVLVRKPKMSSIERAPGSVIAVPTTTVKSPDKRKERLLNFF